MNLLLTLIIFMLIGCTEWFLALKRSAAQIKGQRFLVAAIVVLEVLLGFLVFDKFFINRDWTIVFVYALGCGIGALLVSPVNPEKKD